MREVARTHLRSCLPVTIFPASDNAKASATLGVRLVRIVYLILHVVGQLLEDPDHLPYLGLVKAGEER